MVRIRFLNEEKTIEVQEGTSVLAAAQKAAIIADSPCNGAGTCGKCRVRISSVNTNGWTEAAHDHLTSAERMDGIVLACQCHVFADVEVSILRKKDTGLKILNNGIRATVDILPRVRKEFNGVSETTAVSYGGKHVLYESGDTRDRTYGVAVDIGTTTLVASLVDLKNGKEIAVESGLNPQARFAQDVLSRIRLGSKSEGLLELHRVFTDELNFLIQKITESADVKTENIYEIVYSGNTTMLHLSTKTNPVSLGKYPYVPVIKGGQYFDAASIGLSRTENANVYLPPIVSAYVGADITSGIFVTNLTGRSGTTLFIDIGTNGEMVLSVNGKLTATSTAAGPAFEGMNISCGMRASSGAIDAVNISNGAVRFSVIGEAQPAGICGSGLLDAAGELAKNGYIDKNGRYVPDKTDKSEMFAKIDGRTVLRLHDTVVLTQKDIRQVQLAKAAVRAGIDTMLNVNHISAASVDKVLIAGSFGYHLRPESLYNIGLLPEEFRGKVEFAGNTSMSGAQAFLLNEEIRSALVKLTGEINVLELADYPGFEKTFVNALAF